MPRLPLLYFIPPIKGRGFSPERLPAKGVLGAAYGDFHYPAEQRGVPRFERRPPPCTGSAHGRGDRPTGRPLRGRARCRATRGLRASRAAMRSGPMSREAEPWGGVAARRRSAASRGRSLSSAGLSLCLRPRLSNENYKAPFLIASPSGDPESQGHVAAWPRRVRLIFTPFRQAASAAQAAQTAWKEGCRGSDKAFRVPEGLAEKKEGGRKIARRVNPSPWGAGPARERPCLPNAGWNAAPPDEPWWRCPEIP